MIVLWLKQYKAQGLADDGISISKPRSLEASGTSTRNGIKLDYYQCTHDFA